MQGGRRRRSKSKKEEGDDSLEPLINSCSNSLFSSWCAISRPKSIMWSLQDTNFKVWTPKTPPTTSINLDICTKLTCSSSHLNCELQEKEKIVTKCVNLFKKQSRFFLAFSLSTLLRFKLEPTWK
jgi:hypothetical protein